MTWVKVDDGFFEHPKTIAVGDAAAYLFLAGLGYCNRRLTDGTIPKAMVSRLTTAKRWEPLAERLVASGYWHDRGDHYESHQYLTWNPSRAQVEARRESERKRKQRGAESERNPSGADTEAGRDSVGPLRSDPLRSPPEAPPPKPKHTSASGLPPGFVRFWALYPRRKQKQAAVAVWRSLKLEPRTEEILAGLTRLLPSLQAEEPRYVLYPERWLKRGAWEDEPDGTNGATPPKSATERRLEKRQAEARNLRLPWAREYGELPESAWGATLGAYLSGEPPEDLVARARVTLQKEGRDRDGVRA